MSPAKMLITGELEANSDFEQWWDDENAELFCWSYDRGYLIVGLGTLCTLKRQMGLASYEIKFILE